MKFAYVAAAASALLGCLPLTASAQISFGGCYDAANRPVPSVAVSGLQDIAVSRLTPAGAPVIYYSPAVVNLVGPVVGRFFYLHECAHHALGQVIALASGRLAPIPFAAEQAADCAAIVWLVQHREFGTHELAIVQSSFTGNSGDWTHLPGPVRATNLTTCLHNAGTPIPTSDSDGEARSPRSDSPSDTEPSYSVRLRIWSRSSGNPAEMSVAVDDKDKGTISNLANTQTLDLGSLTAGSHTFDLNDIVGYGLNPYGQVVPIVQGGTCSGSFTVRSSRTFQLGVRIAPSGRIVCAIQ